MINIGIIGAGGIGRQHSRILSQIGRVNIYGVADIEEERAQGLASEFAAKVFTDYKKLLAEDIDAVYICTPPHIHAPQIIDAARAGKHIFCEKPLTLKLKDADQILAAVAQAKVKLMVGYVLHFFPAFRKFKEVLDTGDLGDLVVCWINRMVYAAIEPKSWLADPQRSGGMTIEFSTHDIDWLRWIGGDVRSVYGKTLHSRPEIRIEDNVWAILTFAKGIGILGSSWSAQIGQNLLGIIGTKGMIILDSAGKLRLKIQRQQEQQIELENEIDPYLAESEHFIDCIIEDRKPLLTGEDSRAALEITLAIQKSSQTGKVINLPLK